jgi:hypothetical protein
VKFLGRAVYKQGIIYFDEDSWKAIATMAKKRHKSVKSLVIAALKRMFKSEKEKMEQ